MKAKTKILFYPILIACMVVILVSSRQLYLISTKYQASTDSYRNLANTFASQKKGDSPIQRPTIDFKALRSINPDIVAWLYCEGTPIHYPIVRGKDNDYYLNHLFDNTPNQAGSLFMDANNHPKFMDDNTVFYGHNMKNGSMFASITNYKEQSFYERHPRMLLLTPDGNYEIELFAGYVADVADDSWQLNFENEEDYKDWIKKAYSKSTFQANHEITKYERVVTFSTCSYERADARYVLLGALVTEHRS